MKVTLFISYHSKFRHIAMAISDYLAAEGYDVWIDRNLTPGTPYRIELEHNLENADVVLALWTVGASRSTWVNSEARSAHNRGRLVSIEVGGGRPPRSLTGTVVAKVDVALHKNDLKRIGRALKIATASALGIGRVYKVGEMLPSRVWDISATLLATSASLCLWIFLLFRYGGVIEINNGKMYLNDGNDLLLVTPYVIVGISLFFASMMAPFASLGGRVLDSIGCRLLNLSITASSSRLTLRWAGESLGSALPMTVLLWSQTLQSREATLEKNFVGVIEFFILSPLAFSIFCGIFLLSPKFFMLITVPSIRRVCIS